MLARALYDDDHMHSLAQLFRVHVLLLMSAKRPAPRLRPAGCPGGLASRPSLESLSQRRRPSWSPSFQS